MQPLKTLSDIVVTLGREIEGKAAQPLKALLAKLVAFGRLTEVRAVQPMAKALGTVPRAPKLNEVRAVQPLNELFAADVNVEILTEESERQFKKHWTPVVVTLVEETDVMPEPLNDEFPRTVAFGIETELHEARAVHPLKVSAGREVINGNETEVSAVQFIKTPVLIEVTRGKLAVTIGLFEKALVPTVVKAGKSITCILVSYKA